ncbi:MAG TPA: hypothetical protein VLR49_10230 [Ferruginibacter sp.]|nr:hypothetical protein [Ferruginibacter sp.]
MDNSHTYGIPTYGRYSALITQPVTARVKEINDFTFKNFAQKSILKFGFFPVLRLIEGKKIYIKLYFYKSKIGRSKREIEDFASTYFAAEIAGLSYSSCNTITIPLEKLFSRQQIDACHSMDDLEILALGTLTDDSYVGVTFSGLEGGLTVGPFPIADYWRWKDLLNQGYLEPGFEA